jgi:hypothetical protein
VPIITAVELIMALTQRNWGSVTGTPESNWLDFKRSPYPMKTDCERWELAKDVAALANTKGGLIVIGFGTEKAPHIAAETATEPQWVAKSAIVGDKFNNTIEKWVFPRVRGAKLHWFARDDAASEGVFVIEVPAQEQRTKPFLVEGKVDAEGSFSSVGVGYPYREGDRVEWTRAEEIQHLLNVAMTAGAPGGSSFERSAKERLEQFRRAGLRIEGITAHQKWEKTGRLFLQAFPPLRGPDVLPGFHEPTGIRGVFADPPSLRPMGFNLSQRSQPEVREGALTYLSDSRRALWLDTDGLFIAGAAAVSDFLGWNLNADDSGDDVPLRINSLVLCEYTLEFFRFVHEVLVPRTGLGGSVYVAAFRDFDKPRRVILGPGLPDRRQLVDEYSAGSPNSGDMNPRDSASPGKDAFEVLAWLYSLFGLPESGIPFAEGREVSAARLLEQVSKMR